ncbi:glycosylphosphatidylinositol transamidase subunit Gpi8 [Encephalitozoon intestinalis ATCC 50506]|uniref:Glycosylphosphatidylinositol transamidase subunit Gpi8 n=1 Tax=Encephalitozoon intestinalis (strain ATCC 50506) TaxID=876142 RepID=E0S8W8_ENCIT|nr:glycosylphosphatidylinositol transamidase subunit Gpi8 [Encephalitozoon intestinalis ATCC 50506]ADM12234.1 glycosylphosphatidylinositol transamidase subunit Gpi8 [Encephalitozoon intestinalis ATCC 50506]UTX46043.1 asparaginyl endopeptidase 1 [Encephalitozoon intestinalis]
MSLVFLYALSVAAKNYAILMNSSRGFHNYRHMANVYIFYNVLKENGFKDDQILIISYENQIEDIRNVDRGGVYIDEDQRIPYSAFTPSSNALADLLNALEGRNIKLKDADESSNVFIYLNGHGNETFLKFGNIHFMTKDDLMARILKLAERVNKILLVLDTCQAEALIDREILPSNVFIVATSKTGQPAISSFSSSLICANVSDNFPYFFFKRFGKGIDRKIRLPDLFSEIAKEPLGSELVFDEEKDFRFEDFFVQNNSAELLPFKER